LKCKVREDQEFWDYGHFGSVFAIYDRPLLAYSVEKLCFEKRRDLICDLSSVSYASYEGVAEVA